MQTSTVLDARAAAAQCEEPSHPRIEPLTVRAIVARRPAKLCCLSAAAPIGEALRRLAEDGGSVVVVAGHEQGIALLGEREIIAAVASLGEGALAATAGEWAKPCSVFAGMADRAAECRRTMAREGLRHLPVRQGTELVDLLSLDELLAALAEHYAMIIRAKDQDQELLFFRGTYSC